MDINKSIDTLYVREIQYAQILEQLQAVMAENQDMKQNNRVMPETHEKK